MPTSMDEVSYRIIRICYIRFPCIIRKVVINIPINILGHEEKIYEKDRLVKLIRCVQRCKDLRIESFVRYFLGIVGIL